MALVPFHMLSGKIYKTREIKTKTCIETHYMDQKGNRAILLTKVKKGKRKPSAFNKCVGNTLLDATYKNKRQWQNEFKKAVKKCKT